MRDFVSTLDCIVKSYGGFLMLIGGCVRDCLMGRYSPDIDIEVYGVSQDNLAGIIEGNKKALGVDYVDTVGKSFGVVKVKTLGGQWYDLSVPRSEKKVGRGYRGFTIVPDPSLSLEEACLRRDFTWNAIGMDANGKVYDLFGGMNDLQKRLIRATSGRFSEDPLRVLRGMQMAGRFGFRVHPDTAPMCAVLAGEYEDLSSERVWAEWEKLLLKASVPSFGIHFLRDTGWMILYPELDRLDGLPQDPGYHPEGDALVHSMLALDAGAAIADEEGLGSEDRVILLLACLLHDVGKTDTTETSDGRITSHGHDAAGADGAARFLCRIGCPGKYHEAIISLVRRHMAHLNIANRRSVRRLARKLAPTTLRQLRRVIWADHAARPPLEPELPPNTEHMFSIAEGLGVLDEEVEPILKGRHLIRLGLTPGPQFGPVLQEAFERQLGGEFHVPGFGDSLELAMEWANKKAHEDKLK